MKLKKLFALVFVFLFALSATLTGCGNNSKDKSTNQQSGQAKGGELVYSISSDIDNFNPFTNQMVTFANTIAFNCYEPLLCIDKDMKYVPLLATSWKKKDDKTYVFKLREGVKFHNGEALTPEDVKFTIEYTQDDKAGSWLKPFFENFAEVKVVDSSTVEIDLKNVSNTILDDLCLLPIIKKGTESELQQKPIGTGPFKFVSWSPNDKIVLEKYADYWDKGKPYLDKVIFKPIPDKKIQLTNLDSGTVNFVEALPVSDYENIKAKSNMQIIQPEKSNSTILFEVGIKNVKPFQNEKVMEAMLYALDKETINKNLFNGLGKAINSLYPTGAKFSKDMGKPVFDLDKAKSLIAEAGYPDGFSFKIDVLNGYPEFEKIAVVYQASLAKIGVKVELNKLEMPQWLDRYVKREYDMTVNWYPMNGTDPATYDNTILVPLISAVLPNETGLLDLIKNASSEGDQDKRKELYSQIQDQIYKLKPAIPIIETPILCAARTEVKGIEINPVGNTYLKDSWIEK
jgi:ABC-type dipeptide transport system, periplasmic component